MRLSGRDKICDYVGSKTGRRPSPRTLTRWINREHDPFPASCWSGLISDSVAVDAWIAREERRRAEQCRAGAKLRSGHGQRSTIAVRG